jgi:hypothetical protein
MITGSPTVFPTWKIPVLLEESGGVIVMDDICTGSKELWDPTEPAYWTMNDMLIAIADKYLMNTCACFTPNLVRAERVVQFVKDYQVNGVIYHVLQACHIYGMEELRIEKALDKINIPLLSIETDFSQEDVEQIRTRVEAFLEMVSLRKTASSSSIGTSTTSLPTKPAEGLVRQLETPQAREALAPSAAVSDPVPLANDPIPKANDPIPKVNDPTVAPVPIDPTPVSVSAPVTDDPTSKPKAFDPTPKHQTVDPTPYKADISSISGETTPVKKEEQDKEENNG